MLEVRRRCAVCYSVCWRMWRVGSVPLEPCPRAWGRGGVCLKRSRGALQACRCAGKEVWSPGALEARCRRCLYLPQELWSFGAMI